MGEAEVKEEVTNSVSAETILMDDTNIKEETLNAEMDVNVAEEVSNDVINESNEATTEAVEESTIEKETSNEVHEVIGAKEDEDTITEECSTKEEISDVSTELSTNNEDGNTSIVDDEVKLETVEDQKVETDVIEINGEEQLEQSPTEQLIETDDVKLENNEIPMKEIEDVTDINVSVADDETHNEKEE